MFESAWRFPLTRGKAFVDVDKALGLLFKLGDSLPSEIEQAKKVVADRKKILNDAKEESKQMLQVAEEKIKLMLSKDEFLKRAKEIAESLVRESRNEAKEIKKAASGYVEDISRNAEKALAESMASIREMRRKVRGIKSEEN